jgi:hypothetical protein
VSPQLTPVLNSVFSHTVTCCSSTEERIASVWLSNLGVLAFMQHAQTLSRLFSVRICSLVGLSFCREALTLRVQASNEHLQSRVSEQDNQLLEQVKQIKELLAKVDGGKCVCGSLYVCMHARGVCCMHCAVFVVTSRIRRSRRHELLLSNLCTRSTHKVKVQTYMREYTGVVYYVAL